MENQEERLVKALKEQMLKHGSDENTAVHSTKTLIAGFGTNAARIANELLSRGYTPRDIWFLRRQVAYISHNEDLFFSRLDALLHAGIRPEHARPIVGSTRLYGQFDMETIVSNYKILDTCFSCAQLRFFLRVKPGLLLNDPKELKKFLGLWKRTNSRLAQFIQFAGDFEQGRKSLVLFHERRRKMLERRLEELESQIQELDEKIAQIESF